ncbi:MAG: hypothetical protein AAF378_00005 [Cyanobacteria bacterium P01_A01_bin.84]
MSDLSKVKSELSQLEISDAQSEICADIFADVGVKNPAKMQTSDVEPFLRELDSSDASNATIKRAIVHGVTREVKKSHSKE